MEINKYFIELIQRLRDLDFSAGKDKLTQTEFRLIMEVILAEESGNQIISASLAKRLGISRSAVSQLVTRLEEKDIVKREGSATDKKIAYIKLSDSAVSAFREQCEQLNRTMERVVESYGAQRLESLLAEYDALMDTIKTVKEQITEESK